MVELNSFCSFPKSKGITTEASSLSRGPPLFFNQQPSPIHDRLSLVTSSRSFRSIMSTYTKERSGTGSPVRHIPTFRQSQRSCALLQRPVAPPTSDDEAVDTPAVSRLALPSPHFTFAFASDSRSDLRIVSFICEDGDTLGKPIAFLQHELEEFPSEEEWYRNMDRDTVMIAPPDWSPPQTPLDDGFDITLPDPSAFLEAPFLQPPQSSTASAFAFFQNAFLNRPERPESDTSSVSSGSCYSRLSGESLGSSEESYDDCEQARGTVNSSTLGGLDVYMRTGSIIHWTHHPQYAARIERSSQPSFLRELNAWGDDRFDFDPVTPFARDWQKADTEKPGGEDQGVVSASSSSLRTHILRF